MNQGKVWAFLALGLFLCSFILSGLHYLSFLLVRFWDAYQVNEWATLICWPLNIVLHFGAGVCLCMAVIAICSQRR
jgi:hypothetical protein